MKSLLYIFICCILCVDIFAQQLPEDNIAWNYPGFSEVMELQNKGEYAACQKDLRTFANKLNEESLTEDAIELHFQYAKNLMHQWKSAEALVHYHFIKDLAKNHQLQQKYVQACFAALQVHNYLDQLNESKEIISELLKLENLNSNDQSDLYIVKARALTADGELKKALEFANKALDIQLSTKDSISFPNTYAMLSFIYSDLAEYELSIENGIKAIESLNPKNDKHRFPGAYLALAQLVVKFRNLDKALEYADTGILKAKEQGQSSSLAKLLNLKGEIFQLQGNCVEALENYRLSQNVNEANPKKVLTSILNKLGELECKVLAGNKISDFDLSHLKDLKNQTDRIAVKCRIDLLILKSKDLNQLSKEEFYQDLGRVKNVIDSMDYLFLKKDLVILEYEYFQHNNLFKEANEALLEQVSISKELSREKEQFAALELEARFDTKENKKKIKNLALENEIQEVKLVQQRRYIIFGSITFLLISILLGLIYFLYSKMSSQKNQVSKALEEKEYLLKEIHHRVKNNLQVVSSLLSMQSRQIKDPEIQQAIIEGRNRVRSMALIHQNLYQNENLSQVSIKTYLGKLIVELFQTYKIPDEQITLFMDIEDLGLDVDTMVPLGLIINELVSNCLKHAFPDNRKGSISIALKENNSNLVMSVQDDGVGAEVMDLKSSKSFGNKLIESFRKKLKADLNIYSQNGVKVELILNNYKEKLNQ